MKKKLMTLALGLSLILTVAGCATNSTESTAGEQQPQTQASQDSSTGGLFVEINGNRVMIGDKFSQISSSLGSEVKPAETLVPCEPGAPEQTYHYYQGFNVVEIAETDTVYSVEVTESGAPVKLLGTYSIGDPVEGLNEQLDVIFGEPIFRDDEFSNYAMAGLGAYFHSADGNITDFAILEN